MVPAWSHAASLQQILLNEHSSASSMLRDGGSLPHARRDSIDAWCAAVACRDDAEVERLVRQSRVDRIWDAASGQLGTMVG